MKKLNLVTVAVLASTMVGGVVASAANVAPDKLDTTAKVVFEKEETGGENGGEVTPPGGGGEITPPGGGEGGETPETTADLMLTFAPNFDFGTIKLDAKAKEVAAKNIIENDKGKVTHFVQVKDIRGTHAGWSLSATATELKNGESTLDGGSSIEIKGFNIMGEEGVEATAPTGTFASIKFDGSQTPVMSAAANAGEGIWSGIMGSAPTQTGDTNEDVKLNLTASDAVKASQGEYTSTITWDLVGTPTFSSAATPQV
ncbi:WxL domain-containing protein [Vagococcus sp. PNs007]|uniref:WxL domain-containing protein n=1 Tax=Vagococcus proximus TaxID=2991417 RepID=A0ABT5WZM2_9ENTE|nr:WxL domain-containing protein [Vagococcus proximus]MDF0479203.1 WxL domain-containing protein [Vagococcus proximus]